MSTVKINNELKQIELWVWTKDGDGWRCGYGRPYPEAELLGFMRENSVVRLAALGDYPSVWFNAFRYW